MILNLINGKFKVGERVWVSANMYVGPAKILSFKLYERIGHVEEINIVDAFSDTNNKLPRSEAVVYDSGRVTVKLPIEIKQNRKVASNLDINGKVVASLGINVIDIYDYQIEKMEESL